MKGALTQRRTSPIQRLAVLFMLAVLCLGAVFPIIAPESNDTAGATQRESITVISHALVPSAVTALRAPDLSPRGFARAQLIDQLFTIAADLRRSNSTSILAPDLRIETRENRPLRHVPRMSSGEPPGLIA